MLFNTTRQPRNGKRERLAVSSVAVPLTASAYTIQPSTGSVATGAARNDILPTAVVIQVLTASIYWTIDGTTPTAAIGFSSDAGDYIYLDSFQKLKNFKALRQTIDAALEVLPLYGV